MNLHCHYLVILLFIKFSSGIVIDAESYGRNFSEQFRMYFENHMETLELRKLKSLLFRNDLVLDGFPHNVDAAICLKCYARMEAVINYYREKKSENLQNFTNAVCNYIQIDVPSVCMGDSKILNPTTAFILENRKNLTARESCGILFQGQYCFRQEKPYEGIHVTKPILNGSKQSTVESTGNLTILHFTDFHYDPFYVEGSNAKCQEYVCCRGELTNNETSKAGKWGDYNSCDSPGYLLQNLVQNAAENVEKIDFIYYTGDIVDHFSWNVTREHNINSIRYVTDLIKQQFPNTPVVPVLGNHEAYPCNVYAPSYINDSDLNSVWLYESAAKFWKDWIPEEAMVMFKRGGYYTMLLRPNLRVIVLNSNVCISNNLWLLLDHYFFRDQLVWLLETLIDAEMNNEKVHILGHVPSNDLNCYRAWTREYKKIVEGYTNIISAQFNGHSHMDEFVVFYSTEDPDIALNLAWNGGSGTSFAYFNSNYKVHFVDHQTYEVLDSDTWIFNLTEANLTPDKSPRWFKKYSFKNFYNVPDLSPHSVDGLLRRISKSDQLMEELWKIIIKQSDAFIKQGCDKKCQLQFLEAATRSDFDDGKLFENESVTNENNKYDYNVDGGN